MAYLLDAWLGGRPALVGVFMRNPSWRVVANLADVGRPPRPAPLAVRLPMPFIPFAPLPPVNLLPATDLRPVPVTCP